MSQLQPTKDQIVRFPGPGPGYRRYGTNWTVMRDDKIAADAVGNPWAFRRRCDAVEYLKSHTPETWI